MNELAKAKCARVGDCGEATQRQRGIDLAHFGDPLGREVRCGDACVLSEGCEGHPPLGRRSGSPRYRRGWSGKTPARTGCYRWPWR